MSNMFQLYQGDNLVIMMSDGETFTINRTTNSRFDDIVDALNKGDEDTVRELANPARALEAFYSDSQQTKVEVFGNRVTLNGQRMNGSMEDRLIRMYEARLPLGPLVNFLERVEANPSYTARQELYLFLEGNDLPLTQDGCFMAYKSVNRWEATKQSQSEAITHDDEGREFAEGDWMSIGTSRINGLPTRYRVGDVVEVDRGAVDDNRQNTCSNGLHFASLHYASTWTHWDALLLLKIDPADVVSIPHDYGNQKGRACRFTVYSVHSESGRGAEVEEAFDSPVFNTDPLGDDAKRWQLRRTSDDSLISEHNTRDQARAEKWTRVQGYAYIWDTENSCTVT